MNTPNLDPIPEGTDLYYASRYSPKETRTLFTAMSRLVREIDSVSIEVTDPGVARLKLNWWNEEAARVNNAQARHPLCQLCLAHGVESTALATAISKLSDGLDAEIGRPAFTDTLARDQWFEETFADSYRLLASANRLTAQEHNAAPIALGLSLEQSYSFLNFHTLLSRDRFRYSVESLAEIGVSEFQLHDNDAACQIYFDRECGRLAEALLTSITTMRDPSTATNRGLIILAKLARTTLEETRRDGSRLRQHRVEITPIRKLFIALSTKFLGV